MNLIFDFDGTLIDSFHTIMQIFNVLADEFNFRKVDIQQIEHLRDYTSKQLIKHLEIPAYKIPSVILKARKLMRGKIQTLPCFENLPDVLQELYDLKITLGILTTNSLENVVNWLKLNNLQSYFHFIHNESSYFGKTRILNKIINTYHLDKSATFYIADETRDIEAAKECGIHSVAVTWGFNSEKILAQEQPFYIARKPEDILAILSFTQPNTISLLSL